MSHLNEDQLVAHAFNEDDDELVQEHLQACASCTQAYAALSADLAEMKFVGSPARDESYGHGVWASIAPTLPAYESRKRRFFAGFWPVFSYASVAVALLLCAFAGGRLWEHRHAQTVAKIQEHQGEAHGAQKVQKIDRVVVVVLSDHLDRSERLLVELKHADGSGTALPLRDEARSLLAANQVCRKHAKDEDDQPLSTALDRLDQLLVELANQPDGLSGKNLSKLQEEMNVDGLLFEVRVLRSRAAAAASTHDKGDTI